jgi:hypothetical protein
MAIEARVVITFFIPLDMLGEDSLAPSENTYGESFVNLKTCSVGPRNFAKGKQILRMNRDQDDPDEMKNHRY